MRKETFPVFAISLCFCLSMFLSIGIGPEIDAKEESSPAKDMPGVVILDSITDKYEPVRFDHEEHVDMADSCGECHHQHGTEKTLSCLKCHEIDRAAFKASVGVSTFSPCRECHVASFQAGSLDMPSLKAAYHRACFSCHKEVGTVGQDPKGCTELCHGKKVIHGDAQETKKPDN